MDYWFCVSVCLCVSVFSRANAKAVNNTDNFTRRAYRSRRVARAHIASTATGSSGTLRPHQDVFAVASVLKLEKTMV